jgi:hypothetical protein
VPRKCNVMIIINIKHIDWLLDGQVQELYGTMIPQERGLEGLGTYFLYFNYSLLF